VSGEAEVRIRPLREADIEMIIEIDAEISGEGKPGFWRGLLTVYEPETPEEDRIDGPKEEGRAHPTYLCEVAEKGGEVIGFVLGDVQAWQFGIPRCGRIIAIGVRPRHRGAEVASRLAREILEAFRKMNLPLVQCLVRTGDPLGDFFSSMGFVESSWVTLEKHLG
jgi:ribosomal protein S18 acetylase RimI-like enzyme